MKRTIALFLSLILLVALAAACGNNNANNGDNQGSNTNAGTAANAGTNAGNNQDSTNANADVQGQYQDGAYFAEQAEFGSSGWKEFVAIKVENGKITDVNWNALYKDGGMDKKYQSESGAYGMVQKGGAQAEWHEQAAKMEQFLIEKQDPAAITYDAEDGTTDAVSGVSIHVNSFAELAAQALASGPVQTGPYKDGTYHAEAADFDENSGWKDTLDLTVVNGNIVAVRWSAVNKDGQDKVAASVSGEYGMKAGGASSEWHEQSLAAEKALLEKQDPQAIAVSQDGKTDAITGVSIRIGGFLQLAEQALAGAK